MTGTILHEGECISLCRRLIWSLQQTTNSAISGTQEAELSIFTVCSWLGPVNVAEGAWHPAMEQARIKYVHIACLTTTWGYWQTGLVRLCKVVDCVPT